ncbi:hypothetical protein GCM10010371_67150 [Streptomyces subrutilus]|uniref:Uncharacterized protein n=1 Tax=Streptomyces subrutilus TaxID=36818 RepID=A0A918RIM7_9ACTN|nr:hypothetical protein GCM10010371_67150 [Streptomyces subrutilus]
MHGTGRRRLNPHDPKETTQAAPADHTGPGTSTRAGPRSTPTRTTAPPHERRPLSYFRPPRESGRFAAPPDKDTPWTR